MNFHQERLWLRGGGLGAWRSGCWLRGCWCALLRCYCVPDEPVAFTAASPTDAHPCCSRRQRASTDPPSSSPLFCTPPTPPAPALSLEHGVERITQEEGEPRNAKPMHPRKKRPAVGEWVVRLGDAKPLGSLDLAACVRQTPRRRCHAWQQQRKKSSCSLVLVEQAGPVARLGDFAAQGREPTAPPRAHAAAG